MNRIVNNLEDKQLLTRHKSEKDARYTYFRISDAGRACIEIVRRDVEHVEQKALATLQKDDRETLLRCLRQLGDQN